MTRTEAAHTNGPLSNGPVTPEGKAKSARNALRHGLASSEPVIPGEDPERFRELHQSLIERYRPADEYERGLIQEWAAARWRLGRIQIMETACINREIARLLEDEERGITDPEDAGAEALVNMAGSSELKQLHRYEVRLTRTCEKILHLFTTGLNRTLGYTASNDVYMEQRAAIIQDRKARRAAASSPEPVRNEPELPPADRETMCAVVNAMLPEAAAGGSRFVQTAISKMAKHLSLPAVQNEPDSARKHRYAA